MRAGDSSFKNKAVGTYSNHSRPSSANVKDKDRWSYTSSSSTHTLRLYGVHNNNFAFYFKGTDL